MNNSNTDTAPVSSPANILPVKPDIPSYLRDFMDDPKQSLYIPREFVDAYGLIPATIAAYIHAGEVIPHNLRAPKSLERIKSTCGLFERVPDVEPANAEAILRAKKPQSTKVDRLFGQRCSWCSAAVPIIHEHHYPVPKAKGGTATIGLCPNCHTEFHFLTQPRHRLTPYANKVLSTTRQARIKELAVVK